jgi:putative ATPase
VFLAAVPKPSRAGKAYFAARASVEERGSLPVPPHLRNAPIPRMKTHGIGVGYRYPHEFPGADVEQQYLPHALAGTTFYEPSDQGFERQLGELMERRRARRRGGRAGEGSSTSEHEPRS